MTPLRVTGSATAVQQALEILQRQCFDVIVQQSGSQIGAVYMGLVGIVSQAYRRAVVYMGDELVGLLPLRFEDRELRVGSYIPVRIEAPPEAGEYRPVLSHILTVPGHYAVLTTAPGVRLSKQILHEAERERLQNLGAAQRLEGWGLDLAYRCPGHRRAAFDSRNPAPDAPGENLQGAGGGGHHGRLCVWGRRGGAGVHDRACQNGL